MRKERKRGISDSLSIWWLQVQNEPISVLPSMFSASKVLRFSLTLFPSFVVLQEYRGKIIGAIIHFFLSLTFHIQFLTRCYLNISQGYLFFKSQHSQAIAWAIEIACEFTSIWFCSLQIHAKLNWSFQMQKQCYSQD